MTRTATARTRRARGRRSSLLLGLALTLCGVAPSAYAQSATDGDRRRLHDVSWGHANPPAVSRFVILASSQDQTKPVRRIEVGKPEGVPAPGMTIYSARVALEPDELIAVVAVGRRGRDSEPSRWSGIPPTRPGQPLPIGR